MIRVVMAGPTVIAVEAVFGAESERLTIRRVAEKPGLRRGLDALME